MVPNYLREKYKYRKKGTTLEQVKEGDRDRDR